MTVHCIVMQAIEDSKDAESDASGRRGVPNETENYRV